VAVPSCSFAVHPLVDGRDLGDPLPPLGVLQVHDFLVSPVEVEGDEGYLLGQLIEGVA
jgi:hypothetical protein